MEAAVLNPQMMMTTEVDCNSNTLTVELDEVKKLQELVRRLEQQNEQLRSRANGCSSGPLSAGCMLGNPARSCCLPGPLPPPTPPSPLLFQFDCHFHPRTAGEVEDAQPTFLDELDVLDLDSLLSPHESDETWLYVSSRARECVDAPLTPLQWCRRVLDSPKSEVEAARRSLSLRLEQVSRWRSSFSSPSSSPVPPLSRVAGVSPISTSPYPKLSTPQSSDRHASSLSSPLHRTLSPIGREPSPLAERTPTFLPHLENRSRSLRHLSLSPQSSVDSELEDDSITLGYKLHDLTDVQVMARLQEESLRQDYASTSSSLLANRRSHSFSFHLSQLSAASDLEEEDEEEEDYGLLPPPQPRITRLPHSHTFSSVRDWRRSTSSLSTPPSTPTTPPYPSAGFAFQPQALGLGLGLAGPYATEQQGFRPGSDKLRRSMPNLVRAPSMPSVPIPASPSAYSNLLRSSHSFDSSSGLARLQSSIPSPGQLHNRVHSVGNFTSLSRQPVKATAYVSPTIKGSVSMPTSTSLQSLSGSSSSSPGSSGIGSGIPLLSKPAGGGVMATSTPTTPRSGLPRPASFIGTTSSTPRSKIAQPARSLLTPPKSLSTLSALRDSTWRDGCY
ncbi:SLAIN motif-containing protein 1-like [Diretmus argenteus]